MQNITNAFKDEVGNIVGSNFVITNISSVQGTLIICYIICFIILSGLFFKSKLVITAVEHQHGNVV